MELTTVDRLAVHELMARYGNAIDERDWERLATVFTDDCRYELAGFGRLDVVLQGRAAILDYMAASAEHPVAHHITSVEVIVDGDVVRTRSKMIAHLRDRTVGTGYYRDVVVRSSDGWRIAERHVGMLRASSTPPTPLSA